MRSISATAAFLALFSASASAAEPLHRRIDALIAAGSLESPAPPAPDGEFLRRATLDLNGTVPTAAEARAFLGDRSPDKRAKRIDALLARPAYARRMAQVFDVVFTERRPDAKVPRAAWEAYLRESFAANKPYDRLAREILSADGADPKTRAAAKFYLDRDVEPNLVTRDVGRVFLGRDLRCAQCHDHPTITDYKQDQYYGILAFLARSYPFPNAGDANATVGEKADGDTTFSSVFDNAKALKTTNPRLPGGDAVPDPKPGPGKEYTVKPTAKDRGVPAYSRREQLARRITESPLFARTAANRLWALMLGRGLVHPVDLDTAENPPSHPALLDLLTAEFAAHNLDVKYLLREIALSETYQRSSAAPAGMRDVPASRFLVAALKPLSPEQLADAVMQATGQTDAERLTLGPNATDAAVDARLAPRVQPFRATFAGPPGEPEAEFAPTLDQTLFLKYGPAVRGLIAPRPGNLTDRLAKLTDADAVADELFLAVLSRHPAADERADVAAALKASANRPAVLAELVWSLLASSEFRFNH
jgi:hypothetical protein